MSAEESANRDNAAARKIEALEEELQQLQALQTISDPENGEPPK